MFYELAKKWRSAYEHDIHIYTYIGIYVFMVEFFTGSEKFYDFSRRDGGHSDVT